MTRGYPAVLWTSAACVEFPLSRRPFLTGRVRSMEPVSPEPDAISEIARLLVEHVEETLLGSPSDCQ
jgi:hypothetical protein